MSKWKRTRRSLIAAVVSMGLCLTMLFGTTLAWFSENTASARNKIVAGTLDVELYNITDGGQTPVEGNASLFGGDSIWEPGQAKWVNLRIENTGTLALKYQLRINIAEETGSVNVLGQEFSLSDYMHYAVVDGQQTYADSAAAIAAAESVGAVKISEGDLSAENTLYPSDKVTEEVPSVRDVTLIVYMEADDANNANARDGAPVPQIDLGVILSATQAPLEEDAYDGDYDAEATLPDFTADSVESLREAIAEAKAGDVIAVEAGEYALENNETVIVPQGVALVGVQEGKHAQVWAKDAEVSKTILSRGSESDQSTPVLRLSEGASADGLLIQSCNYKAIMADDVSSVQVRNCAVLGSDNDALDFDGCTDPVVENCYIENIVDCAIELNGCHSTGAAKITGNVIQGIEDSENGAIRICATTGDVLVEDNYISEMHSSANNLSFSAALNTYAIVIDDVPSGGNITVRGNILDTVDYGIAVYKYVSGAEGAAFAVEDNRITNYAKAGITVSTLNYQAPAGTYTRGTVTGNTMDTGAAEALTVEITNSWDETTTGWEVVCRNNTSGGILLEDKTVTN